MTQVSRSKIISQSDSGVDLTPTESRITNLENNEFKILYFQTISATTGTITKPTGATILLDQFYSGGDAIVETLSNGQPTGQSPLTIGGSVVSVSSFAANGNYTLSGTPSNFPVALVYIFKIKAIDYVNLTLDNIMSMEQNDFELTSNKQNSLTPDGTGNKYPTVDAVRGMGIAFVPIGYLTNTNIASNTTYYLGRLLNVAPPTTDGISRRHLAPLTGFLTRFSYTKQQGNIASGTTNATLTVINVTQATSYVITTNFSFAGQSVQSFDLATPFAVNLNDNITFTVTTRAFTTAPQITQISAVATYKSFI